MLLPFIVIVYISRAPQIPTYKALTFSLSLCEATLSSPDARLSLH